MFYLVATHREPRHDTIRAKSHSSYPALSYKYSYEDASYEALKNELKTIIDLMTPLQELEPLLKNLLEKFSYYSEVLASLKNYFYVQEKNIDSLIDALKSSNGLLLSDPSQIGKSAMAEMRNISSLTETLSLIKRNKIRGYGSIEVVVHNIKDFEEAAMNECKAGRIDPQECEYIRAFLVLLREDDTTRKSELAALKKGIMEGLVALHNLEESYFMKLAKLREHNFTVCTKDGSSHCSDGIILMIKDMQKVTSEKNVITALRILIQELHFDDSIISMNDFVEHELFTYLYTKIMKSLNPSRKESYPSYKVRKQRDTQEQGPSVLLIDEIQKSACTSKDQTRNDQCKENIAQSIEQLVYFISHSRNKGSLDAMKKVFLSFEYLGTKLETIEKVLWREDNIYQLFRRYKGKVDLVHGRVAVESTVIFK